MDGGLQPILEGAVVDPQRRLERRDHVADHIFGGVVQQRRQPPAGLDLRVQMGGDVLDHHRMLGDGEGVLARGLAVPAGDAGQPVGDVLDLDVHRRGVQKVQPAAGKHPLPGPGRLLCATQPFPHWRIPSTVEVET